jgi:hypothetical protein
MPPYDLIDFKYIILMFGLGLIIALGIILARGSRIFNFKTGTADPNTETHEFGGDVSEAKHPVPAFIWLVFAGYFIWAIGYVIYRVNHGTW